MLMAGLLNLGAQTYEELAEKKFKEFEKLSANWKESFYDPCANPVPRQNRVGHQDYLKNWFLDGKIGFVVNTEDGMELTAGPRTGTDSHHMVLWTKKSFTGDLKIDFDATRLDFSNRGTNIIYIQATGSGREGEDKDISKWSRDLPSMDQYFNKMNTYHISLIGPYKGNYIRLRRYMPLRGQGLKNTGIQPDPKQLPPFTPGIPNHVTIIKHNQEIAMRISGENRVNYFYWNNTELDPVQEGRIGLRLMYSRSTRYKDFRVLQPESEIK